MTVIQGDDIYLRLFVIILIPNRGQRCSSLSLKRASRDYDF